MKKQQTVFVMLSGGVDSSVAALVLKNQGYRVVGVFMKCWSIDQLELLGVDPSLNNCFWQEDARDARMVAGKLGIDFFVWDFQNEYKQGVVDYMINSYRDGLTPNPDVMCNSVIKFGLFYKRALALGADFVATGHYVRSAQNVLYRAGDEAKDQSYFLCAVHRDVLAKCLFPIGNFDSKKMVRRLAKENGLITAQKKDSQGLCFIGDVSISKLLRAVIGEKPGSIVDLNGKILGTHTGAFQYTIGQRHGLSLSGGPFFVSKIDVEKNLVVVAKDFDQLKNSLYKSEFSVVNINWLIDTHNYNWGNVLVQIRYRQGPVKCNLDFSDDNIKVILDKPVRAVSKGQFAVFYKDDLMLGGGRIT
jgi:tRNA-uridine 2-sulfurtransferase